MLLKGKVVCITGAATGIGKAIAIGMAKEGAKVSINYYPESQDQYVAELEDIIGADHFLAICGDISKPETSEKLILDTIAKFGELNCFVSNAGICQFYEFTEIPSETYLNHININLNGCFFATQALARLLIKQGKGGSIIGLSSISALVGGAYQCHYTPTKLGILSLMQSTACSLGKHGIRCNLLLPGTIRTQLNDEDMLNDEKRAYMEGRIPLGRLGQPKDLAGPLIFLASDLSEYVTGAQILVDGGLFVNLQ